MTLENLTEIAPVGLANPTAGLDLPIQTELSEKLVLDNLPLL